MNVVSNTSPLCYLILIDQIRLLPRLFTKVTIPQAVQAELADARAPLPLQEWIANPPLWMEIRGVASTDDPDLARLHPGEREAILLAQEIQADLLILDEKAARQEAKARDLSVTGLLGVLGEAASRNLIDDLPEVVAKLQATSFRVSPRLLRSFLQQYA